MNSKTILNSNRLPGRGSTRLARGSSVSEHWSSFPFYLPYPRPLYRPLYKHFNFGGQQSWGEKAVEGSIIQHFNTRLLLDRMKYQSHSDVEQLQLQDFLKISHIFKLMKSGTEVSYTAMIFLPTATTLKAKNGKFGPLVWVCHHLSPSPLYSHDLTQCFHFSHWFGLFYPTTTSRTHFVVICGWEGHHEYSWLFSK